VPPSPCFFSPTSLTLEDAHSLLVDLFFATASILFSSSFFFFSHGFLLTARKVSRIKPPIVGGWLPSLFPAPPPNPFFTPFPAAASRRHERVLPRRESFCRGLYHGRVPFSPETFFFSPPFAFLFLPPPSAAKALSRRKCRFSFTCDVGANPFLPYLFWVPCFLSFRSVSPHLGDGAWPRPDAGVAYFQTG